MFHVISNRKLTFLVPYPPSAPHIICGFAA
jgi:hypothetical protein